LNLSTGSSGLETEESEDQINAITRRKRSVNGTWIEVLKYSYVDKGCRELVGYDPGKSSYAVIGPDRMICCSTTR